MTINVCNNKGAAGETRLIPNNVVIGSNVTSTRDLKIVLRSRNPKPLPSFNVDKTVNVVVTVKDEKDNPIDGIDFLFKQGAELKYSIEKDLDQSSFSFSADKEASQDVEFIFQVVKTKQINSNLLCSISVDASSSAFGSSVGKLSLKKDKPLKKPGVSNGAPLQQADLIKKISDEAALKEDAAVQPLAAKYENLFEPLLEGEYNFYIKQYEELISSNAVSENIIPNINLMYLPSNLFLSNLKIRNLSTLNGLIDGLEGSKNIAPPKIATKNRKQINSNIKRKLIKDYFEEFTFDVSSVLKRVPNYFNNLKTQKSFLFQNDYSKQFLPDIEKHNELYPMSINLELYVDTTKAQLTSFLRELGMLDYFCFCLLFEMKNKSSIPFDFFLNKYFSEDSTQVIDLIKNDFMYLGDLNKNISKFNIPTTNSFIKAICSKILLTKLLSNPEIRTDEILMYEIIKSRNGVPITKYCFINTPEDQLLKFFDTQVKYDIYYDYQIDSISLKGSKNITREPILSKKLKVYDLPPVRPDVSFIQYKGEDKKLLINLNSNSGRYNDYPVEIKKEDAAIFQETILNQNKKDGEKIKFETDDLVSDFEIFRMESEPMNYQDFEQHQLTTVTTEVNKRMRANSASFLDSIEPNKKYYYIVRAKDVHGNISNPTYPIEIEMINQNGTIFMRKKEYIFKVIPKVLTKNVRRFIEILPANNQLTINPKTFKQNQKTAFEASPVVLGNSDSSLWEKTYVMRVTSKLTGKKIDIKFKFNYTQPPERQRRPKS